MNENDFIQISKRVLLLLGILLSVYVSLLMILPLFFYGTYVSYEIIDMMLVIVFLIVCCVRCFVILEKWG